MTTPAPTPRAPTRPTTFRELIDLWEIRWKAAEALRRPDEDVDTCYRRIQQQYRRNSINVAHWDHIIAAVEAHHGIILTSADLHDMARRSCGEVAA